MSAGQPEVAVVGRQNVGKSTLVNRLAGGRTAIAHESPGVTRDRVEVPVIWNGRSFRLVDTGGFVQRPRGVDATVGEQAARALRSADLVLLVVDAPGGIREEDAALARQLRRSSSPVLVVANKVDGESLEPFAAEANALGLGEPLPVSALHGRGTGELLDRILELVPTGIEPKPEDELALALVGRPNVGKSSLFNRLIGDERAVVHEDPGTTRDAVDTVVEHAGRRVRFIDTAGFRRAVKTRGVEYYGLVRSLQAIVRAHVALLVVDASDGLTGEDKRIAAKVFEAGRGLAVVANKWDLVSTDDRAVLFERVAEELKPFPGVPLMKASAITGAGVAKLMPKVLELHGAWSRRIPTAEVNRVLQAASGSYPAPRKTPGRIRYGTQVAAAPPMFVLFGMGDPGPSYRRYLENSLRREFGFGGVPIRMSFRRRPAPDR